MTIAIIHHPDGVRHEGGLSHPEYPQRVVAIQETLAKYSFPNTTMNPYTLNTALRAAGNVIYAVV